MLRTLIFGLSAAAILSSSPTYAQLTTLTAAGIWTAYAGQGPNGRTCSIRGSISSVTGSQFSSLSLRAASLAPSTVEIVFENSQWSIPFGSVVNVSQDFDVGTSQVLTGLGRGNRVLASMGSEQLIPWMHGFTAGRSVVVRLSPDDGHSAVFPLAGTTRAITAMSDCIKAAGFPDAPKPFLPADRPADAPSSAEETLNRPTPLAMASEVAPAVPSIPRPNEVRPYEPTPSPPVRVATPYRPPPSDTGVSGLTVFEWIAGVIFALWSLKKWSEWRLEEKNTARSETLALEEIRAQANALQIRRRQTISVDVYGTTDFSKWEREKGVFLQTRVLPLLSAEGLQKYLTKIAPSILSEIELVSRQKAPDRAQTARYVSDPFVFDARMAPTDYEHHCAILLNNGGWETSMTPATGDQGADVIAQKGGVRLVLQCKLYSQPVGNKAVQEAYSAKNFQACEVAAVVSNAAFTSSARQIAATTGVHLLHHDQLETFDPANAAVRQGSKP